MRSLLGATAWSALGRADAGVADAVPDALFRLCRARSARARHRARDDLYCPLSNQGTAGEASPAATEVLVTALREGWCRDREPVYDVLQEVGRATVVRPAAVREPVLAGVRSALSGGLDVYLADLAAPGTGEIPSLFELLILLAPRHDVIVERLRAASSAGGPTEEALRDALEHIEVHAADPDHC